MSPALSQKNVGQLAKDVSDLQIAHTDDARELDHSNSKRIPIFYNSTGPKKRQHIVDIPQGSDTSLSQPGEMHWRAARPMTPEYRLGR